MIYNPNQVATQLGPRLAVYKPRNGIIVWFSILFILVGLPFAIFGWNNPASNNAASSTLGTGVVLVLGGIAALVATIILSKLRIFLHEGGFVSVSRKGTTMVRWDQVTHVWHKLKEPMAVTEKDAETGIVTPKTKFLDTDRYIVQSVDGTTCEIDTGSWSLSQFAPIIEQIYPRYLVPRALASYRQGNTLTFGTLSVSRSGVSNGDAQVAWGEFSEVNVDKKSGDIRLKDGEALRPWSSISITDTPNVAVFEGLVNTVASGRG